MRRALLLPLALLAGALVAARPASAGGEAPPGLVLTIEAPRPRVAVQEPILLVATLANPTAATLSASGIDRAWDMAVEVRDAGSPTWTALPIPSALRDARERDEAHPLAPGASRVDARWAYPVGPRRLALAPGRAYALRVRSGGLVSNEARVEVVATEGALLDLDPLLLVPEEAATRTADAAARIAKLVEASPASLSSVHLRRSYLACARWSIEGYDPAVARRYVAALREQAPWALAGDRERLGELMEGHIRSGVAGPHLAEMLRRIAEDPATAIDAYDAARLAAGRIAGAAEGVPWGPTRAKRTAALLSAIPDARAIQRLERLADGTDIFTRRAIAEALTASRLESAPGLLVTFPGPALAAGMNGLFSPRDRDLVHEALWSLALDARRLDDAAADALRPILGDTEVSLARQGLAVVSEADPPMQLRATLAWLEGMGSALGAGKPLFAGRAREHRRRVLRAVMTSLGEGVAGGPPAGVLAAEAPALRACAVRLSAGLAALRARPSQDYDTVTAHRELEELTVCVVQTLGRAGVPKPALPLTLAVERSSVLPLEPILVRLTIANPTSAPAVILGTWWNSTRFDVRSASGGEWRQVEQSWLLACILYAPSWQILGPGETCTAPMWLYSLETDRTDRTAPPTSTAALALARPSGPYLLRARQAQCSTEARIDLAPLPEEEQAPLAAIIAEPGRYGGYCLIPNTADAAAVSRTAALVEAYPDSRYSIYLRRTYLLRSERARRDANVDGGRAMGYETWLREHAPWSLVEEVHRSR